MGFLAAQKECSSDLTGIQTLPNPASRTFISRPQATRKDAEPI